MNGGRRLAMLPYPCGQMLFYFTNVNGVCITQTLKVIYYIGHKKKMRLLLFVLNLLKNWYWICSTLIKTVVMAKVEKIFWCFLQTLIARQKFDKVIICCGLDMSWEDLPAMSERRKDHCVAAIKNCVYVLGGSSLFLHSSIECFNIITKKWHTVNSRSADNENKHDIILNHCIGFLCSLYYQYHKA